MKSNVIKTSSITLPLIEGEFSMIPFDLTTLDGLPDRFKQIAKQMLMNIKHKGGNGYFTIHGKKLKKGDTLRRGGAHIDGNYEPTEMDFGQGGGNGWKVGENGRPVGHVIHNRQYVKNTGGVVMASNYHACNGWEGEYKETPEKGGDCTHFDLGEGFELEPNSVYYGNNHFIHESIPMKDDVHRVLARITMPENHVYKPDSF